MIMLLHAPVDNALTVQCMQTLAYLVEEPPYGRLAEVFQCSSALLSILASLQLVPQVASVDIPIVMIVAHKHRTERADSSAYDTNVQARAKSLTREIGS